MNRLIFLIITVGINISLPLIGLADIKIPSAGSGAGDSDTILEIDVKVANSADDAIESMETGTVDTFSKAMKLTHAGVDTIGVRFQDLPIPKNADIVSAEIEFTAGSNTFPNTDLIIHGENHDSAPSFQQNSYFTLSNRVKTRAQVKWKIIRMTGGNKIVTPDLKRIVQEIINRKGWGRSPQAMVFLLNGMGMLNVKSYENLEGGSEPRLRIRYLRKAFALSKSSRLETQQDQLSDQEDISLGRKQTVGKPVSSNQRTTNKNILSNQKIDIIEPSNRPSSVGGTTTPSQGFEENISGTANDAYGGSRGPSTIGGEISIGISSENVMRSNIGAGSENKVDIGNIK